MNESSRTIVLAGATGWAGSALARGIDAAPDLRLVGAVSRSSAGRSLGAALGDAGLETPVYASAAEALGHAPDIFVEYTKPDVARANVVAALQAGAHVVIGTSGLTAADFEEIDALAREKQRGVLACGNFSLTAVLMLRFSALAAKWIPNWEVIDYAHAAKKDAPSGTARELAARLSAVATPHVEVPIEETQGEREARGAEIATTRVHSVRLPGYVLSVESLFGLPDESLTLRHDAGSSAQPYVGGALLAIRGVDQLVGLHRGLDTVMQDEA